MAELSIPNQTSKDLSEKIRVLENERTLLANEVEKLKKAAEMRAAALEEEIYRMRQEANILRQTLGSTEKTAVASTPIPVPQPKLEPTAQVDLNVKTEPVISPEPIITPEPIIPQNDATTTQTENAGPPLEAKLETLSANERKVINLLMAHEGPGTLLSIQDTEQFQV